MGLIGVIAAIAFSQKPTDKPRPSEPKANILRIYSPTGNKSLTDFPNSVAARTRILIDGKDEEDVRYLVYIFLYDGERPIRTTDFEVPFRGVLPGNRKIIGVQQSLETGLGIYKFGTNQITCEIQQIDQRSFEIKPLLMNPGDWFKVEVYSSALPQNDAGKSGAGQKTVVDQNVGSETTMPDVSWSCRVAGVRCLEAPPIIDQARLLAEDGSGWKEPLQVTIRSYSGWAIYFIVLFTIFNLVVIVVLARRTSLAESHAAIQFLAFAVGIFLSMAAAEILADWFFHGNTLMEQPAFSPILLLIDIGAFLALGIRGARQNRGTV